MSVLDESRDPRAGEELPVEALAAYLKQAAGIDGPLRVTQFPSGHSNLTYLVEAGDRQLVLRRPPFGSKVKTAHDMGREHRILTALSGVYPCPKPVAYCEDESVMGARFYLMERIRGVIVRKDLPKGMTLSPDDVGKLDTELVDKLADLHAIDADAVGLGDLGKPEGYVERQVTGWTKRYEGSKTYEVAAVDAIARWLAERIPKESGATLIHNDYKLDNVVLAPDEPTKIIGVLDWEMSTLGDPLMDLGTALSYWVEAGDADEAKMFAFGPTFAPGAYTRREVVARYAETTGRDVSDILFHYAFALFKTAVVAQQIYYRFRQGLTKDERFAMMIVGVRILSAQARSAIDRGTIDP